MRTPPFLVNLTALETRLNRICLTRASSPRTQTSASGATVSSSASILGLRREREQVDGALDQRLDLEGAALEIDCRASSFE